MGKVAQSLTDLIGGTPLLKPNRFLKVHGLEAEVYLKLDEQLERNEIAEKAATAAAKAARVAAKLLSKEDQKEKKRAQREYEKWATAKASEEEESEQVVMSSDIVLDMFIIQGIDQYKRLVEEEKLVDITSYINGSQKLITK